MNIIPQIASAMQTVLTTVADTFGDLTGFSLDNLSYLNTQQVYWLSRIFSQCVVTDLHNKKWDLVYRGI